MVEKKIKSLILASIVILVILFFFQLTDKNAYTSVCIKKKCFHVEIADTYEKQKTGLMGVKRLDSGKGMLFVFDAEGEYGFWMKNMSIPLDIIWVDGGKKVVYIARNLQPCTADSCFIHKSDASAKYVLEINGGEAEKAGIKIGDEVEYK